MSCEQGNSVYARRGLGVKNGDFLLSCFAIESREKPERGIRVLLAAVSKD